MAWDAGELNFTHWVAGLAVRRAYLFLAANVHTPLTPGCAHAQPSFWEGFTTDLHAAPAWPVCTENWRLTIVAAVWSRAARMMMHTSISFCFLHRLHRGER